MSKKNNFTYQLIIMAFLIALQIILVRFLSIQWIPTVRISLGFLPMAMASIMFGPLWGSITYIIADTLGILLFPTSGAYFPGFTISAFLIGIIYGLFLYNKKQVQWTKKQIMTRTIFCVLTEIIFISLLLNTLWLKILYGKGFFAILPGRLLQAAIMTIVEIVLIYLLQTAFLPKLEFMKK